MAALLPSEAIAMLEGLNIDHCHLSNRKLILIELNGGNDGLNTVIPLNQYDLYSNLRPVIKVPESGNHRYIQLDTSLADEQQVGLHPALTGFKDLYDAGNLKIIQSVGYPKQNKSHFASRDLYNTGNDGNGFDNGRSSGWIGRFLENRYQDELSLGYPLAIQLGSVKNSLGFYGEQEYGMSLNITQQDTSGLYSIINGLAGEAPLNIPSHSDYGHELDYIIKMDKLSNVFAESVSTAFNLGTNSVTYPSTDISNQLKTVAKLIKGGLKSKIYMVRLNGFDTHANQVQKGNGEVKGKHNTLLSHLSQAVSVFMNDMSGSSQAEEVVAMTYSEFGRKAAENGSKGTDHGEVAPMFVIGQSISGGVIGTNPQLKEAVKKNNWQIQTVQYDYRSVYANILKEYLGGDKSVIDSTFMDHTNNDSFADTSIQGMITSKYRAYSNCNETVGFDQIELENERAGWFATPQPFSSYVDLRSDGFSNVLAIKIIDTKGTVVKVVQHPDHQGFVRLNLTDLRVGAYYALIYQSDQRLDKVSLIKV